ncbi:hypothetical protein PIB30_048441 [Stylosanthes scabra]|uniref:SnoaL-like domain-containing protein n=1 Tax=Stylosanthes scabra TaxID=79078 RepID=A0ABU6VG73_9FABA|nr:hypothetical protein [Stylosanthes scabra]
MASSLLHHIPYALTSSNNIKNIKFTPPLHIKSRPKLTTFLLVGENRKNNNNNNYEKEKWKAWCIHDDDGSNKGLLASGDDDDEDYDEDDEDRSPRSLVLRFYEALEEKEIEKMKKLLSPKHCVYHDFLFYGPYEGKQNVVNFLENVMDALGESVKINLEIVDEERGYSVVNVYWHLEWKQIKIPFTSGFRIFTFEEVKGRLYISQITGLEELPLKPGELVLKLIKSIRTVFDNYPLLAQGILESHASQDSSTKQGKESKDPPFDIFGHKK